MAMEPADVVRSAWDAFSAGDVEGALRFFTPDAEWHVADDYPGPSCFRGHDELRVLLDSTRRFSVYQMTVNEITDMGGFVLAHGVVYAEENGRPVIDRVTIWRCRVADGAIVSINAEAERTAARWEAQQRTALEG